MNANEYILTKQSQWAQNQGIELIGSKIDRGRKLYTTDLDTNLFEPLSESTRNDFLGGDGGELSGYPAKMQALHSSSALGVNIFQYWDSIQDVSAIAQHCSFCRKTTSVSKEISFEVKYSIDDRFQYGPNIDVVIKNDPSARYKVFAIECKFSEAYGGRGHSGLKEKYLDLDSWSKFPALRELAITISPNDNRFELLHAAQLVKHVLGLARVYGKQGFRLLYLWYDVLGRDGVKHRDEIDVLLSIAKKDDVKVHAMSYQELIARIARDDQGSHREYVEYIASRYL